MPYPYTPPSFLQNQTVDSIHRRMMATMPDDIDKSELQTPWDFTRPAATIKSELASFELNETIKLIFPQWSYDDWLDKHAEKVRVVRRSANKASGTLSVTGIIGTTVPPGFQFATPATLTPSVIYETKENVILDGTPDERGRVTVNIDIQAVEGGITGNVPPDAIKLMVKPISGISYITNIEAITGGTPAESDDSLIERTLAAMRLGSSFTGNNADYIRWAQEVKGVGNVICIPEATGPGTVALIIVDENGTPANQQILDAVYIHIMGTDVRDIKRLAPIGATLSVAAPTGVAIDISAAVYIGDGEDIGTIATRFKNSLNDYWHDVAVETQENEEYIGYVRYVQIGAVLAKTPGITDYSDLLVNGGIDNILITQEQYPVTGDVVLSEVSVDG